MKITSIKQQVKRTDRYSIYVDEKYSFSLSESALVRAGIASGQELTPQQVDEYKQLSADDKAFGRALRYAAMRSRSEWEMRSYMQRKEMAAPLIDELIERLTDLGLLNDAAYAESFVHDRQLLRPTSSRKLVMELKKKRIPEQYITAALNESELNEADSLRQIIAKKQRQTKYQDPEKLMQYLARQGFSYSDIKRALDHPDYDD